MTTMTVPTLTRHDLQERKDRITATDVAAIMGTSPWKTKYDVWIEKCLDMEPIVPSPAMLWGSLMEDDIITYAEARLREHFDDPSIKATRVGIRRQHANGIMACTLDSVLQGRDEAIEAKTHAAIHPNVDWTAWGTEEFVCNPVRTRTNVVGVGQEQLSQHGPIFGDGGVVGREPGGSFDGIKANAVIVGALGVASAKVTIEFVQGCGELLHCFTSGTFDTEPHVPAPAIPRSF